MGWKNWSTWVKGGVIGILVATLITVIALLTSVISGDISTSGCSGPWWGGTSFENCKFLFRVYIAGFVIQSIIFFIIGAIIGLIIGKIKNKKQENIGVQR